MSKDQILARVDKAVSRDLCTPAGEYSGVLDYVDTGPLTDAVFEGRESARTKIPKLRELTMAEHMNKAAVRFHSRKTDLLNHAVSERTATVELTAAGAGEVTAENARRREIRAFMEWFDPTDRES